MKECKKKRKEGRTGKWWRQWWVKGARDGQITEAGRKQGRKKKKVESYCKGTGHRQMYKQHVNCNCASLPVFNWSRRRPHIRISGRFLVQPCFRTGISSLRIITLKARQGSADVLDEFVFLCNVLPCLQHHYRPECRATVQFPDNVAVWFILKHSIQAPSMPAGLYGFWQIQDGIRIWNLILRHTTLYTPRACNIISYTILLLLFAGTYATKEAPICQHNSLGWLQKE